VPLTIKSKTVKLPATDGFGKRVLDAFIESALVVSVLVILLGFLTATVILLLIGKNPAGMYQAFLQVVSGFDISRGTWNVRYIGEWFVLSAPLVLCGLSMAFAARTGLFNIGAEGQYITGITAAQLTALYFPSIPVLHWIVAVLSAIIAGAVWGGIAGFLKARYRVSEVVATIMMNYIALYIHRFITLNIPGSSTYKTRDFPMTALISSPFLASISNGSRLNYGLWFTVTAVFLYWIIMEKTVFGFSLQATGFNREASWYAGINVKMNITLSMAISGAFASLAGASIALGVFSYGRIMSSFDGYGFDGIAVALAGNNTAAGTALIGLLFGLLKSAQPLMQSRQIPKEITSIIIGLVVVFISLRYGLRIIIEWRMRKEFFKEANKIKNNEGSG
jgi:simple sugar transport system permease protein